MRPIKKIGFIGLGVMGSRISRNLSLKSRKEIIVYDVDTSRLSDAVTWGARAASSTSDLLEQVDIVFLSLPGEPEVRDIAFGINGLIANIMPGQTVVDMSTTTVEINRQLAAALNKKDAYFADAPVSRGVPAAENGTLSITVGSDEKTFKYIKPLLDCIGTEISYCGGVGTGQVMKLMNNMICFQTVTAIAEALAIATRAGVDRARVFDILSKGSSDSYAMRKHGVHMTNDDYPSDQFPTTYSLKDMKYALSLAKSVGVNAAQAQLAADRFAEVVEKGDGHLYCPVVYKLFDEDKPSSS